MVRLRRLLPVERTVRDVPAPNILNWSSVADILADLLMLILP